MYVVVPADGDGYGDRLQPASSHTGGSARDGSPTPAASQPPSADSPSSPAETPPVTDFGAVSLDDAWRTLSGSTAKPPDGKDSILCTD